MAPVVVDFDKVHEFVDGPAFERWLAANFDTADEIWIKIHKKGSGRPTISTAEAIDASLCWGWIDAIRKSFDEDSFLQRYTPRGKRSIWSEINTRHVERLIAEGRMQPSGLAQVEAAKADGRWDRAYGGSRTIEAPPEFLAALAADAEAQAMFDRLTAQNRFAFIFRIHNLRTEAARVRKIAEFVEMLRHGETIYPNGKSGTSS
jgi:uncharacterized protein YdeI (YjbR/CyaY-like superfamily)